MTEMYRKDGQGVQFEDSDQMAEGYLSGTFGFKKNQKVNIYKPEFPSEVFSVDESEATDALSKGYVFETGFQKSVRDTVEENDNFVGSLKVGAAEFANSLTFGVPEIVLRETSDPLEWAKINALRDDHDIASLVGTGAGIGANVYGLAKTGVLAATEKISEQAVNAMSRRIIALTGQGKSVADKTARTILKKTLQGMGKGTVGIGRNMARGAIEGSLDMSVPAAVEAAFGNYEAAGETMLLGSVFGGLFGGSIRSAGQGLGKARDVFKGIDDTTTKDTMYKAAGTALNRDADALEYVANNINDVTNARPKADNLDDLNAVKFTEEKRYKDASDEIQFLKDEIEGMTKRQAVRLEAVAKAPDREVAAQLADDVSNSQSWLKAKGEERDFILADEMSDPVILKTVFTEPLDKKIKYQSQLKGKKDRATTASLMSLRAELEELPELLTGKQAQLQMGSIRRDINWDRSLGDFDEAQNIALKNITEEASDQLKWYSDSYREAMEDMAPVASAINELSRLVGKDPMSLASTITKLNPTSKQLGVIDAFENFKSSVRDIGDFDGIDDLYKNLVKEQRDANLYVSSLKNAKIDKKIGALDKFKEEAFPKYWKHLKNKEADFKIVEEDYRKLAPILKTKTKNLMRHKEKDIEQNRAFEFLDERHSNLGNISKRIKDTSMLEYMEGPTTQGSRAVNMYGAAGFGAGLLGGPVMHMLLTAGGAILGGVVDRQGGKMFMRGALEAEEHLGKFARNVDTIEPRLKALAIPDKTRKASKARKVNSATNQLLLQILAGQHSDKKMSDADKKRIEEGEKLLDRATRVKAWSKLGSMIVDLKNPEVLNDRLNDFSSDLMDGGAPNVGMKAIQKMQGGLEYIDSSIPKDPMPVSPFKKSEWEPSDYDLRSFEEKLTAIYEPLIIFDALESGKLTRNHVEAIETVYPELSDIIKNKVVDVMSKGDIELDYSQRVGLSHIMGVPLESSITPESFLYYQSVGAPEAQQEEQGQQPSGTFRAQFKTDPSQLQSFNSKLGSA